VLPTRRDNLHLLNQSVIDGSAYDLEGLFRRYPQLKLEFYEITFSIFASKKVNQNSEIFVEKEARVIEKISQKHL